MPTESKAKVDEPRRTDGPSESRPSKMPSERPGQPGGRRDTNRKERTKALVDAALSLFLTRGIEAVTIEDITQKAGVAKGSFYRYFDDKEGLVVSMFEPIVEAVQTTFDSSLERVRKAQNPVDVAASYEVISEGFVRIILEQGDVCLLYLQENRGPSEGARAPVRRMAHVISSKAIEHTAHVRAHGILRPFPAEISTLAVIGAAERLLYAVLSGEQVGEPLEIPGALVSLILDGILAPEMRHLWAEAAQST